MTQVTTLDELLPLLDGVTTARGFGAVVIAHVPTKPRGIRQRLALVARDALGFEWTDSVVKHWLAPGCHSDKRSETQREANREANRRWYEQNREAEIERSQRWQAANPEAVREACRRQRGENPDYYNDYRNRRRAEDPAFAVAIAARNRIGDALRAAIDRPGKTRPSMELLGCSAEEYRVHLEGLFEPGMSWENWAHDGWHVDHTVPVAAFDLTTEEGQRAAFHYTNTRPMWADENMAKGSLHDGVRHRHGT